MKKITLSLLLLSSLAFSADYYYYDSDDHHYHNTDYQLYVSNQAIVNDIVTNTTRTEFATSDKTYFVTGQYINVGDVSMWNIPFGMNLNKNIGLEANLPIVTSDGFDIGDISVGANYHFGNIFTSSGANITTLRYKLSTGDENKGAGSGGDAITISHSISKNITPKYNLKGLIAYTMNDDKVSGDAYVLMFGGSTPCLLSDKVRTAAKITYTHIDSHTASNGWYSYTTGEVNSADLWLEWSSNRLLPSGYPIGLGFKIPILNELDGNSADKSLMFYLSVSTFIQPLN